MCTGATERPSSSPTHRPRKSHLLTDLWSLPCSGFYLLSFWRNHFKSKCFQKATAPGRSAPLTHSLARSSRVELRGAGLQSGNGSLINDSKFISTFAHKFRTTKRQSPSTGQEVDLTFLPAFKLCLVQKACS